MYLTYAGSYYLAFGQLQKATALFQRLSDANVVSGGLVWVAALLDDTTVMRAQLSRLLEQITQLSRPVGAMGARPFRVVQAGLDFEPWDFDHETWNWELALGELAFRRGDLVEAIERLAGGLESMREACLWGSLSNAPCDMTVHDAFDASESLASAWQRLGNEEQALGVLEEAARRTVQHNYLRPQVSAVEPLGMGGGFGRFRVRARLASEYRKLGRLDEAVAIEDEVLRMLKYADADHPIVRQINESRASL